MTGGIIQEVIGELINAEKNVKKKGYDAVFETNEELLLAVKKELIAEIHHAIPRYGSDLSRQTIYQILFGGNN